MRKVWLVVMALALFGAIPAAFTQNARAAEDAATICHRCEWIKIQIGDIDDKIASWERQIRSINKYSDLSDPNIQNALKDIDSKIAALKAKKADLEAQLVDCKKRCAEAQQQLPPKPAAPPPPGGGSTSPGSGSSAGGSATDNGPSTGTGTGT